MELEALEISAGTALEPLRSSRGDRPPAPRRRPRGAARACLEAVVLQRLEAGTVAVSFSGGRDSSLVLAVATHVARREGLPEPVPVTMRHGSARSQERPFQEAVVRHLGLQEWQSVETADSLDLLGSIATDFYEEHGLFAPPNAYLHLSMVAATSGGSLLTGVGGDEILGGEAWRVAQVLAGRVSPRPRDLALLGFAAAPTALRRRVARRAEEVSLPWLTPAALEEVRARLAADTVRTRVRWDVGAVGWLRSRSRRMGAAALAAVAAHGGVVIASPLVDPRFVTAFAGECGSAGPRGREWAMRELGGDLLPEAVLARRTKAAFDGLLWGPLTRAFVAEWDPATLQPEVAELVDVDRLRAEWSGPEPSYGSLLVLQKAWLDQVAR